MTGLPTKSKKRRRRSKQVAKLEDAEHAPRTGESQPTSQQAARRERRITIIFAVVLLTAIAFELWLLGRNGEVRICVGRAGVTDFDLIGAARTEANFRKIPVCESRFNVGFKSELEPRSEEALYLACRKATLLEGQEARAMCFGSMGDWKKHVTIRHVRPWEQEYLRRLLWFFY